MYARRETIRSFTDFRERLVRTEVARSVRNAGTGARVRVFAGEKPKCEISFRINGSENSLGE